MNEAEGAVPTWEARQGPFYRWRAARRRSRAELRSAREHESGLAANLGLAGEIMLDRLSDREEIVVSVVSTDDARRRWLYAQRIQSNHYGEGISYVLADTDHGARSLLEEPRIGVLYPDYEEATVRLNALTSDDAVAVRDASAGPDADIDPERLRSAVRDWFEGASTMVVRT